MVLGSPKPEEIPLSWIQPGTAVLNCSHDFLSGKCVKIGTGPAATISFDRYEKCSPYSKEYIPEVLVIVNIRECWRAYLSGYSHRNHIVQRREAEMQPHPASSRQTLVMT